MTRIYEKILKEQGEEAAKAYMASIRSTDKPAGGLHYSTPEKRREIAKKASEARWGKKHEEKPVEVKSQAPETTQE